MYEELDIKTNVLRRAFTFYFKFTKHDRSDSDLEAWPHEKRLAIQLETRLSLVAENIKADILWWRPDVNHNWQWHIHRR